jgi:hypothetical protein
MGYIGNQQTQGFSQRPAKQDLTGATGTSLTLSHAVASAEGISLFINNVRQEPTTAYSIGADGVTITLTGSVVATDDIYVVYNSLALQTTVPPDASVSTAKIIDGNVTAAKLAASLDLSSKTLTLPSGYVKQVYDSGFISIATDSWITVTHNIALPYTVSVLQKVLTSSAGEDAEYSDNDVIQISPNTEISSYNSTGFHSISKDNSLRVWGHAAVGAVHHDTTSRATGYLVRQTTNGTRFLIYKAQ